MTIFQLYYQGKENMACKTVKIRIKMNHKANLTLGDMTSGTYIEEKNDVEIWKETISSKRYPKSRYLAKWELEISEQHHALVCKSTRKCSWESSNGCTGQSITHMQQGTSPSVIGSAKIFRGVAQYKTTDNH